MLHFQYTRNCSIGHFFPLFLPPTYEWPRPTVLKNCWVFFGELQFYIIWYMSPTCILCFFWAFYWLWHNLTRLPGKYASTTCTPKSRQSLDASSWREIAGAIGTGRNMTNQNEDVILFRPPQTTIQSHIHTQVTHKNTTPNHISLYFNLPEHLQTQEHQLPLPNRPPKHHIAGQEKSSTKIRITSP